MFQVPGRCWHENCSSTLKFHPGHLLNDLIPVAKSTHLTTMVLFLVHDTLTPTEFSVSPKERVTKHTSHCLGPHGPRFFFPKHFFGPRDSSKSEGSSWDSRAVARRRAVSISFQIINARWFEQLELLIPDRWGWSPSQPLSEWVKGSLNYPEKGAEDCVVLMFVHRLPKENNWQVSTRMTPGYFWKWIHNLKQLATHKSSIISYHFILSTSTFPKMCQLTLRHGDHSPFKEAPWIAPFGNLGGSYITPGCWFQIVGVVPFQAQPPGKIDAEDSGIRSRFFCRKWVGNHHTSI